MGGRIIADLAGGNSLWSCGSRLLTEVHRTWRCDVALIIGRVLLAIISVTVGTYPRYLLSE
jgi:hypothetical protein